MWSVSMLNIRPFQESEAVLLKEVRLNALQDSPSAFASKYVDQKALPDDYWLDIVLCRGKYEHSKSFLAEDGGKTIAMTACFPETKTKYRIIAMWVSPQSRSAGIGTLMLSYAEAWAQSEGANELLVAVFSDNPQALKFYLSYGFVNLSGEQPEDERIELQLVKSLVR